jgi:hypothetical protein
MTPELIEKMNIVKPMDFCRLVSRKATKDTTLNIGEVVLVAGLKPLPEKRSDPYLQRIYAIVLRVVEDVVQIPKEDNEYVSFIIDPRGLERMSEKEQESFHEKLGDKSENHSESNDTKEKSLGEIIG